MDKVRPENQSEHTPVGPARAVASPSATPRPRSSAAKAAGAFCKKQQPPAWPGARLQFTAPPPMDKVRPENQSEHTPVGPARAVASPSATPRPRSSAAKAAGAFCKKQQPPAWPGARLQFTAPPPMDKVRPENQSEHTPVGPARAVASPSATPRPRSSAAKAAGAFCKKQQPPAWPGARLQFTAPPPMDKVRPENQSEHTPVGPARAVASPSATPRPRSSAAKAAGAFCKKQQPPAWPGARLQFTAPPPMDKVRPENQSEHTPVGPARAVASPSATPRPRSSAAKAAGAFCKKQQPPAWPGARLQFTAPPPMDKVRPENQSEHTPVGPARAVASPSATPRPRSSAAKAAGAFCKKQQPPAWPGARLQFTAPPPMDKVRPENQSEHTPVGPARAVASPSATPRPRSSAAKAAGAFCKKQQPPAWPGARLQFTAPPPMDKAAWPRRLLYAA